MILCSSLDVQNIISKGLCLGTTDLNNTGSLIPPTLNFEANSAILVLQID